MNDDARDAAGQWKAKAQSDWTTVQILMTSEHRPADTVCFHCQQYVEKLLKGVLTLHLIEAPRTHDLRRLIQLAQPYVPELSDLVDSSDDLTVHGVETRYPGEWRQIEPAEVQAVVELAEQFGKILLPKLDV
jgi:HEPN domain-containing protein